MCNRSSFGKEVTSVLCYVCHYYFFKVLRSPRSLFLCVATVLILDPGMKIQAFWERTRSNLPSLRFQLLVFCPKQFRSWNEFFILLLFLHQYVQHYHLFALTSFFYREGWNPCWGPRQHWQLFPLPSYLTGGFFSFHRQETFLFTVKLCPFIDIKHFVYCVAHWIYLFSGVLMKW